MTRSGVAMTLISGVLYDHPVRQASAAIQMANGYRVTGDRVYLDRAERNAQRLLDKAKRSGDALFFPYPFAFALHGNRAEVMRPPWYSAMAQGLALSAFVRLYELTGNPKWRSAADAAFASLKIAGPRSTPWVVWVDRSGYLWLEEYPYPARPDRTFNGHLFAVIGLAEYWELTGDPNALLLIRGALATVQGYAVSWRLPGGVSRYCMAHVVRSTHYHLVHTGLAYRMYQLTGQAWWARLGDAFVGDYPNETVSGLVRFAGTTHTGYKFDRFGHIVARKTVTLSRSSVAYASARRRVVGRSGMYLALANGAFAGYLVLERPLLAYLRGIAYPIGWDPPRRVDLAAGTYTAIRLTATGAVDRSVSTTFASPVSLHTTERAIILGRLHYLIADGPFEGLWLAAASNVRLT